MITIGGYRYGVARYVPFAWMAALLAAAALSNALPWAASVGPAATIFAVGIVVIAARMIRGQEPPWFTLFAGAAWIVLACWWELNWITGGVLLVGGLAFGWSWLWRDWPARQPVPYPPPYLFESDLGATVFLQPPRRRRDPWMWWCNGCPTQAVGSTPDEDLRDSANDHALNCRGVPRRDGVSEAPTGSSGTISPTQPKGRVERGEHQ